MLILLSPSKTLDFEKARILPQHSYPEFTEKAIPLIKTLANYSPDELMVLMKISHTLAQLNYIQIKKWTSMPNAALRQAVCAFQGDVYTGLQVNDWHETDFSYSQEHLRILSGLYGVLRPLDYIAPYRLEMGTKLQNPKGETLYKYWEELVTQSINKQLQKQGDNILVNLASSEYFKVIQAKKIKARWITPVFKEAQNGQYKIVSFFAKKARGMMSRFIIKNQLQSPEHIKEFCEEGYSFNERLSNQSEWIFTRDIR